MYMSTSEQQRLPYYHQLNIYMANSINITLVTTQHPLQLRKLNKINVIHI